MKYQAQIIFLVIFISAICHSQKTNIEKLHLNNTFSFIYSQQMVLDKIKHDFPEQSSEVKIAELEFNKKFGVAVYKIKNEVKKLHGTNYDAFLVKLNQRLKEHIKYQKISREYALTFIGNIKSSDKESIQSPILAILLNYQYQDNPVDEFLDNYVTISSVRSYSNSSIIDLSLKIPLSWKELDGNSPAMLKKFRSNYGSGKEIITIVVKKLPENSKILPSSNNKIIRSFLEKKQYIEINPKVSPYQKRHIIQHDLLSQGNLIQIKCTTYGSTDENFDLKFQKLNSLYELIIQSIELEKKSKKNNLITNKI